MLYALRKLIAFVFLLGIFWFVYRDPGNVGKPSFMSSLGVLTLLFGIFWMLIPPLVVNLRVRRRVRQNEADYAAWRVTHGSATDLPRKVPPFLKLDPDEVVKFHEKGTLYVARGTLFDAASTAGRPGDVAFPGMGKLRRKVQRTHFYLTDRRILFVGKALDFAVRSGDIRALAVKPGGLVFTIAHANAELRVAFTFRNPLVVAFLLRR